MKLTVAEYAKLNNISVQAVYKRLHKLDTVEENINGRQQILIIIEETTENEIDFKPIKSPIQPTLNLGLNHLNPNSTENAGGLNLLNPNSTEDIKPNSTTYSTELNLLKEQLNSKDAQIEGLQLTIQRLQDTIDNQNIEIKEQFDRFTTLLARAQELELLSQRLLTEQEQKKQSFFDRIFKRKRKD